MQARNQHHTRAEISARAATLYCRFPGTHTDCKHKQSHTHAPDTQGPWSAHSTTHISMNFVAYRGRRRLNHSRLCGGEGGRHSRASGQGRELVGRKGKKVDVGCMVACQHPVLSVHCHMQPAQHTQQPTTCHCSVDVPPAGKLAHLIASPTLASFSISSLMVTPQ